jgi:iron complex outermembrane receptor protein
LGTAADERLRWIGGLFYYQSDVEATFNFQQPAMQTFWEAALGIFGTGAPLPSGSLEFISPRLDGSTTPIPFADFQNLQDMTSIAIFGQGIFDLTDDLRVTVGGRWTRDKKDVAVSFVTNLGAPSCLHKKVNKKWAATTGRAALDYDLNADMLVYGSVSRGFKAGGVNVGTCDGVYDPEFVWAYEVGLKSMFFDNRVRLNAAAFYYDYTGLQTRIVTSSATTVLNAPNAKVYGLEVEWLALITENFRFEGNLGLLNAEYKNFLATDPLNPTLGTGCDSNGFNCLRDLSGNPMLRAPDIQVFLAADYLVDLNNLGSLVFRTEWSYTDNISQSIFKNETAMVKSYSITNLRLTYKRDNVLIQAFVENVTNKNYVLTRLEAAIIGATVSQFAPPRTFGLMMSYEW